jgi:nucleoid-associated protein YgaU
MAKFKPLELQDIEEGDFVSDLAHEFKDLQRRLIAFARQYPEKAAKVPATLTVKIKLMCEQPEGNAYSIKTGFKADVPKRPEQVSAAFAAEDDDGDEVLFVQASGSSAGNPRQRKLATRDGRTVNQETGEAVG